MADSDDDDEDEEDGDGESDGEEDDVMEGAAAGAVRAPWRPAAAAGGSMGDGTPKPLGDPRSHSPFAAAAAAAVAAATAAPAVAGAASAAPAQYLGVDQLDIIGRWRASILNTCAGSERGVVEAPFVSCHRTFLS